MRNNSKDMINDWPSIKTILDTFTS
jgi:hypothetical protein